MLETKRLLLRQWRDSDAGDFIAMNADAQVMRYFPAPHSAEQSSAAMQRQTTLIAQRGWGLWAVEERSSAAFIGFIGLAVPNAPLPFQPCVEVGWRLREAFWGRGYAVEGGQAALRYGFETVGLASIVSFTALTNHPSQRVMQKLGMRNQNADFDHPSIAPEHPLCRHCLYVASKVDWRV